MPLGLFRNLRCQIISTRLPSAVSVARSSQLLPGTAYTFESVTVALTEPSCDQS
jgi:hypothetical protein